MVTRYKCRKGQDVQSRNLSLGRISCIVPKVGRGWGVNGAIVFIFHISGLSSSSSGLLEETEFCLWDCSPVTSHVSSWCDRQTHVSHI